MIDPTHGKSLIVITLFALNTCLGALALLRFNDSIPGILNFLLSLYVIFQGVFFLYFIFSSTEKIKLLQQKIEQLSESGFIAPINLPLPTELKAIETAINQVGSNINQRIRQITDERNQKEEILSSMIEGIITIDTHHQITNINPAAASYLNQKLDRMKNKHIKEIISNQGLHKLIEDAFNSPYPVECDIILQGEKPKFFQIKGIRLVNSQNIITGALIVMEDVTRLTHLENIRRDFVANVSHELKTPIALIMSAVETLQERGISHPEIFDRFTAIIKTHSERLNAIIEDLLSLSRIEQGQDHASFKMERYQVGAIIHRAAEMCLAKAVEKSIKLKVHGPENIWARVNPPLLEQAIINLTDNSIKYSSSKKEIELSVTETEDEVIIYVKDNGYGIEPEHIPRLFERFYRVDKARSRKIGGTGLGLAIVKHIVEVHNGRVEVESELNKGSTFSLHLPREIA